jgi:hypothetical protein
MFRSARILKRPLACRPSLPRRFESLESRLMLDASLPAVTKVEVSSTQWTPGFVQFLNGPNTQTRGYAIPLGSATQSTNLTWDNIDQVILTFNKDVNVYENQLSLTGVNVGQYFFQAYHYDPLGHTATWTLSAPISNDKVRIDLDADGSNPVMDLDWNILDGEWTNNSSVTSGDGEGGGDFEFAFNVLPTDVNNSSSITSLDYDLIHQLDGKTTSDVGYIAKRDIDGNGVINSGDWQEAIDRVFQTLPSGAPGGASNNAPTSGGFDLYKKIDNDTIDYSISLASYFDDHEDGGNGLTYSIVSNSNSALFDSASITTNSLVVNAASDVSGRSSITIRATDSDGLSVDTTVTIDVKRDNIPPEILGFSVSSYQYGVFYVSGRVVDGDDDVSNAVVTFTGVFTARASVDELGYFLFAVYMRRWPAGIEYASTADIHGAASVTQWCEVNVT